MAFKKITQTSESQYIVIDTDVNILKVSSIKKSKLTCLSICDKDGEHTTILDLDEIRNILTNVIQFYEN